MSEKVIAHPLLHKLHANRVMLFPLACIGLLFVLLVPLPKALLDFLLIESNNRLAVDDGHRCTLVTHVQQLLQCRPISAHVLVNKFDSLLRKKLFLFVAGASPGLAIDDHDLRHVRFCLRVVIERQYYHVSMQ
jgi:hypothetical protein